MTRNYINGFMSKMAEYGVRRDIAEQLLVKRAAEGEFDLDELFKDTVPETQSSQVAARNKANAANRQPLTNVDIAEITASAGQTEAQHHKAIVDALTMDREDEEFKNSGGVVAKPEAMVANLSRSPETVAAEKERLNNLGNGINTAPPVESTANERGAARTWLYGNRGALGAAGGALAAGGLGAYLANRLTKNRKNKRRNAIIAAILAGGAGGVGGYYGARAI